MFVHARANGATSVSKTERLYCRVESLGVLCIVYAFFCTVSAKSINAVAYYMSRCPLFRPFFVPVLDPQNVREILAKKAACPLPTWNYAYVVSFIVWLSAAHLRLDEAQSISYRLTSTNESK
jgi:hypothetical protein